MKEIVKENLIYLRKSHNYTQIDLAKKINFSDKAVSRWENGDVIPDLETIEKLSKIYSVSIAYFFEDHKNNQQTQIKDTQLTNKIFYSIVSIMAVWTTASILFFYLTTLKDISCWQIFIWAVPVSCLIFIYSNHKWLKIKKITLFTQSILVWSLLASIYCQFLSYNIWLIFIIGIPLQITIIARYYLK